MEGATGARVIVLRWQEVIAIVIWRRKVIAMAQDKGDTLGLQFRILWVDLLGSNNLNPIDGTTSCQGTEDKELLINNCRLAVCTTDMPPASEEGGELCADGDGWCGQHEVEDHLLPGRPVFHQPGE